MEEEWRVYLRENAPGLYKDMLSSVKHAAKWRDDEIKRLKTDNDFLKDKLRPILELMQELESLADKAGGRDVRTRSDSQGKS